MKKLLVYLFVVTLCLSGCRSTGKNTITIGVITPLTGYASLPGQMCMKGVDMAKNELSQKSKIKYEFIVEDCKSSPQDAVSAFRRLYSMGVRYFIVCGGQFAMAVAPLTKDKDVIMFATATANIDLLNSSNRCFRMFPHPKTVVETLYNFASDSLHLRNVSITYVQNDAYALYADLYSELVKQGNGQVLLKEGYATNQKDFKDIITKIVNTHSEYIFLSGMGESVLIFSKQVFSNPQAKHLPIFGDMNFSLPNVKNVIGNTPTPIYYVDSPINEEFKNKYYEQYAEQPNAYSYYSYVIPYIVDEMIGKLGDDSNIQSQIEYVKHSSFYIASERPIKFDESGEVNLELSVNVLRNE